VIHVATRTQDFLYALGLWTSVAPSRDFPAKTVGWRLTPAFLRGKLLIMSREGRRVGFCIWGWMTGEEFTTRTYHGPTMFARESGERLVITDAIITDDVTSLSWELREFYRRLFPDVSRVYANRGRRTAIFCI